MIKVEDIKLDHPDLRTITLPVGSASEITRRSPDFTQATVQIGIIMDATTSRPHNWVLAGFDFRGALVEVNYNEVGKAPTGIPYLSRGELRLGVLACLGTPYEALSEATHLTPNRITQSANVCRQKMGAGNFAQLGRTMLRRGILSPLPLTAGQPLDLTADQLDLVEVISQGNTHENAAVALGDINVSTVRDRLFEAGQANGIYGTEALVLAACLSGQINVYEDS